MIVISISVLLGVLIVRKITLWLPYLIQEKGWSTSLPAWFDPYGVAITGLLIGALVVVLINWSFRVFVKDLEKES
jgi:hypothetical protein